MDTYTIGALAIGGFALVIGVSRLVFRALHIAKYGSPEVHNAGPGSVGFKADVDFRSEKRTSR